MPSEVSGLGEALGAKAVGDGRAGRTRESPHELGAGDDCAPRRLFALAQSELLRIAQRQCNREGSSGTLEAAELVNEAFLRLFGGEAPQWASSSHMHAAFASVVRHVLIDAARSRTAQKRESDWMRSGSIAVEDLAAETGSEQVDELALCQAMERMAALGERHRRIVELRFFWGLSIPEVAEALGVCTSTVNAEWTQAKAWLRAELGVSGSAPLPALSLGLGERRRTGLAAGGPRLRRVREVNRRRR